MSEAAKCMFAWNKWSRDSVSDLQVNWVATIAKDAFVAGWEARGSDELRRKIADDINEAKEGPTR